MFSYQFDGSPKKLSHNQAYSNTPDDLDFDWNFCDPNFVLDHESSNRMSIYNDPTLDSRNFYAEPNLSRVPSCSIIIRKVRRSVELKGRTAVACFACKSRKKKCDNLRPCSRCVRLGRAARCASWKESEQVVEFPIVFNATSLQRQSAESIIPAFVTKHQFMLQAILTLNSCGLRLDSVAHIFNSMPPCLIPIVLNILCPPNASKPQSPREEPSAQKLKLDNKVASPPDCKEIAEVECLTGSDFWEADDTFGYFELVYDPGNTSRWRKVGMNSRYASIHGYHKEELLARYASGEAELQRLELDALMFFLFSFKGVLGGGAERPREFYSRIFIGSGEWASPLLVWVTMGNSCTPSGQAKVSVLVKAIGPDEYDAAVRTTPAACVLAAMGDRRSGRELLADFPRDARRTVAAFGTAPGDDELLRSLAAFSLS